MAGIMSRWRGWLRAGRDDRGQSLVEVALMLPILLLLVLATVDVGRVYAYKAAVTNAAREAAIYAARDPQAAMDSVCQRARDELGAGGSLTPCAAAPMIIACVRDGIPCGNDRVGVPPIFQSNGGDVTITVTYEMSLLSAYLVGRAFQVNPVAVGATAVFSDLGQ